MGNAPPYVHLASTRCHSHDRCSQAFPIFRALPLPCIKTEEQKTGEAWERGYVYCACRDLLTLSTLISTAAPLSLTSVPLFFLTLLVLSFPLSSFLSLPPSILPSLHVLLYLPLFPLLSSLSLSFSFPAFLIHLSSLPPLPPHPSVSLPRIFSTGVQGVIATQSTFLSPLLHITLPLPAVSPTSLTPPTSSTLPCTPPSLLFPPQDLAPH